jgi:hypothetical protein
MSMVEQSRTPENREPVVLYETVVRMLKLKPAVDEYNQLEKLRDELMARGVTLPQDGSPPEGYVERLPDWEVDRF